MNLNNEEEVKRLIDEISRNFGIGELSIANTLLHRGFNHRGVGNPVNTQIENNGILFFTRPNLNLSEANLLAKRILSTLTTRQEYSIPRMVRAYLDPRSNWCEDIPYGAKRHNESPITSALVDAKSPFIPILTNNLVTLSGWPDISVDSYTSEEGIARQTWSMVDSIGDIYNSFDLTANFRRTAGDSITLMFLTWILYSGWVYRGDLYPYPESMVENEMDYNTRIYRFVLDPSRRFIRRATACGYAYPTAISVGSDMNYNADRPNNLDDQQITVPFKATGAMHYDPIVLERFNDIGFKFCAALKQSIEGTSTAYVKIPHTILNRFPNRGLPHANLDTMELEWWVIKAEMDAFNAANTRSTEQ